MSNDIVKNGSSAELESEATPQYDGLFEILSFSIAPLPQEMRTLEDPWQLIVDSVGDYETSNISLTKAFMRGRLFFVSPDPNSPYPDKASPLDATQLSLEDAIRFAQIQAKNIAVVQQYSKDRVFVINADRDRIREITADEPDMITVQSQE